MTPSPAANGPMRVLMLLHDLSRTGAPKVALDAVEWLGDAVEAEFIAAIDGPLAERCCALGRLHLPFMTPPAGRVASRIDRWRIRRAWKRVHQWRPELIYVNTAAALSLAAMLEQRLGLPSAPILLHVHELDSIICRVDETLSDWLRERPTLYISVSQAVTQALTGQYGISPDRIHQVPAFIRESEYDLPSPPPGDASRPVVGGAGTPGWRKGTTLWLQTAAEVHRRRPEIRFRWIGIPPGPNGESFRRKIRLMHLEEAVEVVAPTAAPLQEFAAFDTFLMTSWEDPFPLVVLENMRLGNPVICLPGGGSPEQVGDAGIIVDRFDPCDVADAVIALLDDPARRERLSRTGLERVRARYTDEECVPQLWKAMRSAAEQISR